jgi:hypothetical protein
MAEKLLFPLEQGRSYLWLCAVYGVLFLAASMVWSTTTNPRNLVWPAMTMHIRALYIAACELRSKIALDAWWVAAYPQGMWQYRALLAWHVAVAILALIAAIVVLAY